MRTKKSNLLPKKKAHAQESNLQSATCFGVAIPWASSPMVLDLFERYALRPSVYLLDDLFLPAVPVHPAITAVFAQHRPSVKYLFTEFANKLARSLSPKSV
jgi:hypothetical protein